MTLLIKKKKVTKKVNKNKVYIKNNDIIRLVAITRCGDVSLFDGKMIYDNGESWVAADARHKILTGSFGDYFNIVHMVDDGIHRRFRINGQDDEGIVHELRIDSNKIDPFTMNYEISTEEDVTEYVYEPMQVGELLDVGRERPVKIEQIFMRQSDVTGQVYTVVIASDEHSVYTAVSYPEFTEMKFYEISGDEWVFKVDLKR